MDTVFRSKITPQTSEEKVPEAVKSPNGPIDTGVEVPFTDYQKAHSKPYTVDYFKLSELWDDPQGGFNEEIGTIEKYLSHKIESGDLVNSVDSVKNELKRLEKENDMTKEDRITIKLGVLSAYTKFLMETEGVRFNVRKYANS